MSLPHRSYCNNSLAPDRARRTITDLNTYLGLV